MKRKRGSGGGRIGRFPGRFPDGGRKRDARQSFLLAPFTPLITGPEHIQAESVSRGPNFHWTPASVASEHSWKQFVASLIAGVRQG